MLNQPNKQHYKSNNQASGFVKMILLVIGALVLLKYAYKVDVVGILTTGRFKEWLDKLYTLASKGWGEYKDLILKIWNFVVNFLKEKF